MSGAVIMVCVVRSREERSREEKRGKGRAAEDKRAEEKRGDERRRITGKVFPLFHLGLSFFRDAVSN